MAKDVTSQEKNKPRRILIVDDDRELSVLLQQALGRLGPEFEVHVAHNTDEAMALISKQPFELVITDIRMAGLSGLQLLEILNKVEPQAKTIAMTAFDSTDIEERARHLRVHRYITKPFTVKEFRQVVQEVLAAAPRRPPSLVWTSAQEEAVRHHLSELRLSMGAYCAFLARDNGQPLCVDGVDKVASVAGLAGALAAGHTAVAEETAHVLGQEASFQISHYAGASHNVYSYILGPGLLLGVVCGPEVKPGLALLYIKRAVQNILQALEQGEAPAPTLPSPPEPEEETSIQDADAFWEAAIAQAEEDFGGVSLAEARQMGLIDEDFLRSLSEEE